MVSGRELNLYIMQSNQEKLNKNNYGKTEIFTQHWVYSTKSILLLGIMYIVIQKKISVENWNLKKYLY